MALRQPHGKKQSGSAIRVNPRLSVARLLVGGCLVAAATYLHCVTVSVDRHGDLSRQASVQRLGSGGRRQYRLVAAATCLEDSAGRSDGLSRGHGERGGISPEPEAEWQEIA